VGYQKGVNRPWREADHSPSTCLNSVYTDNFYLHDKTTKAPFWATCEERCMWHEWPGNRIAMHRHRSIQHCGPCILIFIHILFYLRFSSLFLSVHYLCRFSWFLFIFLGRFLSVFCIGKDGTGIQ